MKKITKSEAKKRYKAAGLILLEPYINTRTPVRTKCGCGKEFYPRPSHVFGGRTFSCGCLRSENTIKARRIDRTGEKIGRLIVLKYSHTKNNIAYWLCQCNCGNETIVSSGDLGSKHTQSCGNCQNKINGQTISLAQTKVYELLSYGSLNYKLDKYWIDITLVDEKIAIEYNEWFYHGYKQDYDKKRSKDIIKLGWKVLNINANDNIPTKKQIRNGLNILRNSPRKIVNINLKNWGVGKTMEDYKNFS